MTDIEQLIAKRDDASLDAFVAAPQSDTTEADRVATRGAGSTLGPVTSEASRLLDAAMQLPERERAELAAILLDSVGDGSSPQRVEASWIAEAKRRLEAVRRGESTPVSLDDMMRRLRSKDRRPRESRASTG